MKKCPMGNQPCRKWDDIKEVECCAKAHCSTEGGCVGLALFLERQREMDSQAATPVAEEAGGMLQSIVTHITAQFHRAVALGWGLMDAALGLAETGWRHAPSLGDDDDVHVQVGREEFDTV